MDKLKMQSVDITETNIDKIALLFPNVVTEVKGEDGKLHKAIDFEKLKLVLSAAKGDMAIVDDDSERYEFTWPGKKQVIVEAATPIRKTLRPCVEESKNWDTTENLYLEGDNLEVLKLLQESYLGRVKMIYIDPPYNTGKDFIYKDNFTQSKDEYEEELGLYDEDENRLFQNNETNGRFHSDWCSMIYPRLQLARNLLTDDGVVFISIDDNEVENLRKICDEVFGEDNFLGDFIWKRRASSAMSDNNVSIDHEYVVCFHKGHLGEFNGNDKDFKNYTNPDNDPRGPWVPGDLTVGMTSTMRPNQAYDLVDPKTGDIYPFNPNRVWTFIPESMAKMIEENRILFPKNTSKRPMQKRFMSKLKSSSNPFSSIMIDKVGLNTEATKQIQNILGGNLFDYSKPLSLVKTLIPQVCDKTSIILDFFSGSATTAHAVMQLNAEDGGNRKFIMVQLPEECDKESEAAKAGYKNICEIGKERIRRAGDKIVEELKSKNKGLFSEETKLPDIGFRVLKLDSTNMKDVYYSAAEYSQSQLDLFESNIKEDRTDLDLLYGCLLDWGVYGGLQLPHKQEMINAHTVHFVNDTDLVACFDEHISEETIRAIAKRKPMRAVFKDASFKDSADKINVTEIFKSISPDTTVKVI